MRRALAFAAVLTTVLLAGGCVSLPAGAPPPRLAPAAARTPSLVPDPGQAPALSALVSTGSDGTRQPRPRHRRDAVRESAGRGDTGHRSPRAESPTRPRSGSTAARPAHPRFVVPAGPRRRADHPVHPARPARPRGVGPRQPQPQPTYDLRTVCGWSHRSPVPPSVRQLCDAYVG
ncbi:hypothetical protein ACN6K4_004126 [Streptomyces hayashii]|uniref:hypothetical protein n=1 Tax=Streptomyces hayashii TaxID=2839966 RepID=UPI00403C37DB